MQHNPYALLRWVRPIATGRQWTLFNIACCRRIEGLLHEELRQTLSTVESSVDGKATKTERRIAIQQAEIIATTAFERSPGWRRRRGMSVAELERCSTLRVPAHAARAVASCCQINGAACFESWSAFGYPHLWTNRREREASRKELLRELAIRCRFVRDIFGNPFRETIIKAEWLNWNQRTVRSIAKSIYEDESFEELPILGDALEDAGCDNQLILRHCREHHTHIRGCWVLDLLLGLPHRHRRSTSPQP